jgi:outer membrane protein assembly factor BamA
MKIQWQNKTVAFLLLLYSLPSLGQEKSNGDTVYQAYENRKVTIRHMTVTGNRKTKDRIIFREVYLEPDSSYPMPFILESIHTGRTNLINTALFVDATVDFKNWFNDSLDIVIDVKERWYWFPFPLFKPIDRNWNVWINQYKVSLDRVNYGIKFLGNNVTGRNDKLNLYLVNGYTKQVAVTYQNPFVGKSLNWGYSTEFSYSKNREINYSTRDNEQIFFKNEKDFVRTRVTVGAGLSYKKASTERHTLRLNYTFETVSDTIALLNPKFFGNGKTKTSFPELSYKYQYFKVNYIPYPLTGFKWEFNFMKRGIGGPLDMWLFSLRGGKYWPMPDKFYFALQGDFTVKLPFDQPYYNLPLMGYGDTYLRGMEYYVIDGVASGLIKSTFRKQIFDLNWHTGFKSRTYGEIPFKIFLKTYGDIGYTYNKNNFTRNSLTNRFLYSGGFGIDVVTIYDVVFKLEYSFNLLNERALFVHLNEF